MSRPSSITSIAPSIPAPTFTRSHEYSSAPSTSSPQLNETNLSEGCVLCRSSLLWDGHLSPVTLREFEDMVKKYFVGQGPYPTYILPSSSKTTPPPTTNPFPPPPATLAPTPTYGHCYPSPPKPDFPPPNSSYITPPTSPDTPSPSYSTSTSPASTASPPTPPGMEDCTARIVSASSSPGIPKHEPVPYILVKRNTSVLILSHH
ncbi:hypothetical protein DFJ58DRAFT_739126 [Suillus subalutaceus]|uniref:uncharacterized protein n=1 Tax=Suillus subalutaceus TaxID=48586 RepID=UPI001B86970E|nr:uncharacterized protein DFJ58DRAFT_739126 [Suillus subalutaceus]KAG1821437.1 hypothetical protein DFJ58DRAFT_739126 [Suillus subalutaceus]